MKKIISLFILILSMFSLYSPSQTFACSCMMPQNPEIEMEKADYVFIATVDSLNQQSQINQIFWLETSLEVTFKNITNIKWVNSPNFLIHTPQDWAACWINFKEDKEYIVYAHESDNNGRITSWLCGRTTLTEYAEDDLAAFKDIIQKNKNTPITKTNSQINYFAIIWSLITLLILLILWIYKLSKQKNTD